MTRRRNYGFGKQPRTRIERRDGVEYVPLDQITVGSKVHDKLTEGQLAKAKVVWDRLPPLQETQTYEAWTAGFLHDRHPDRELDIWLRIADKFHTELAKQHHADHKKLLGDILTESFG